MKNVLKLAAAAAVFTSLTAATAFAGNSTVGTVTATVITPLSEVQTTPMSFGTFAPSTTASTVDSYGNTTGGALWFGGASPAVFTANGTPTTNFTVVSDSSVILSSGSQHMTAALTAPSITLVTDGAGNKPFNITGLLSVAANQAAGSYAGTYNVSVHY